MVVLRCQFRLIESDFLLCCLDTAVANVIKQLNNTLFGGKRVVIEEGLSSTAETVDILAQKRTESTVRYLDSYFPMLRYNWFFINRDSLPKR